MVADHPRVGHQAFEDAALHIEAVATDAAHHDVVDRKIVDPAVVAVGDDLDAVALASVALDREIRQRQIAEVHAGTGIYLDDRRAVGDLRNDRCPAKIDAQRSLDGACDVYDDGRGDRVGLPAHLRHVATGNGASERGSWIVPRYLHGVAPPADCLSFQPMATMQLQRFRSGTMFTSIDCGLSAIPLFPSDERHAERRPARHSSLPEISAPYAFGTEGRQFMLRRISADRDAFDSKACIPGGRPATRAAHTRASRIAERAGRPCFDARACFLTQESNCEAPRLVHAAMPNRHARAMTGGKGASLRRFKLSRWHRPARAGWPRSQFWRRRQADPSCPPHQARQHISGSRRPASASRAPVRRGLVPRLLLPLRYLLLAED